MDCPPHYPGWYCICLDRAIVSTVLDGMCYDLHLVIDYEFWIEVVRRPIHWEHPRRVTQLPRAEEFGPTSYYPAEPSYQLVYARELGTMRELALHYIEVVDDLPTYLVLGVL